MKTTFTHLRRTTSKSTTGQDVETFSSNGTLFGEIEEVSASKKLAYGVMNTSVDVVITMKQHPQVDAKDRLQEKRFNQLLVITGISKQTDSITIYAYRLTGVV